MLDQFRWFPFIIGIVCGALTFAFYKPSKQVIYEYPHPSNTAEKVFRDPSKMCYKYTHHEVNCDSNESTLKEYPIQG